MGIGVRWLYIYIYIYMRIDFYSYIAGFINLSAYGPSLRLLTVAYGIPCFVSAR